MISHHINFSVFFVMSDNHCESAMRMHDSCFCLNMLKIDSGGGSWMELELGNMIDAVRA